MKTSTAGMLVLTGLVLAGCSRPVNVSELAANFRDKVSSDAATAAAKRAMRPMPNDYDYGGGRQRPKPAAKPEEAGADGKAGGAPEGPSTPGGPITPSATPAPASAPTVVYYYAPSASSVPSR